MADNVMPVGWSMIASGTPVLYAVAINAQHHTTRLIRERGVRRRRAIGNDGASDAVLRHALRARQRQDRAGRPTAVPATTVRVPLLAGAVYNLECVLHKEVETGDHITFVGEVVAAHLDEDAGGRLMNFGARWACAQEVRERPCIRA